MILDIETAPHKGYFWDIRDTYINPENIVEPGYTLCWAAKWHGRASVMFGSVNRHSAKQMVQSVHKLLDEADAVVHFNGKKFDIPTLNKEFLLHGLPPPAPFRHIDLFQVCKRRFRFASNKLDFVSRVLGIGAKVHHKGMELWHGCMAGDRESWKVMEAYNKGDVRLTEQMYDRLLPWIDHHPNVGLYSQEGRCCPRCKSTKLQARGYSRSLTQTFRRFQCKGCGAWSRERMADKSFGKPELVAA